MDEIYKHFKKLINDYEIKTAQLLLGISVDRDRFLGLTGMTDHDTGIVGHDTEMA